MWLISLLTLFFNFSHVVGDYYRNVYNANWWAALDGRYKWARCRRGYALVGLWRNHRRCNSLYCIEMARCARPKFTGDLNNCRAFPGIGAHGRRVYGCPKNWYLSGFYKGNCENLRCLEKFWCCRSSRPTVDMYNWRQANWWASFDKKGWSLVPNHTFMTGVWKNHCEALYCIETATYSSPMAALDNDCKVSHIDFGGADIRGHNGVRHNWQACRAWCANVWSCRTWTWNTRNKRCYLKHGFGSVRDYTWAISGTACRGLKKGQLVGHRTLKAPFKVCLKIYPYSIHPGRLWKNIYHYGNHNGERGIAMWIYPHNNYRVHVRVGSLLNRNNGCDPGQQLKPRRWQDVCVQVNPMGVEVFFDNRLVCRNWFNSPVFHYPNRKFYLSDPWYHSAHVHVSNLRITNLGDVQNPILRYWRGGGKGNHFYTTNWHEIAARHRGHTGRHGYRWENSRVCAFAHSATGRIPIYRYYHPGIIDHFYTQNWNELQRGRGGWKYEGILGYGWPAGVNRPNTYKWYRYWNPKIGDHFYTDNYGELGRGKHGWRYEGIVATLPACHAGGSGAVGGNNISIPSGVPTGQSLQKGPNPNIPSVAQTKQLAKIEKFSPKKFLSSCWKVITSAARCGVQLIANGIRCGWSLFGCAWRWLTSAIHCGITKIIKWKCVKKCFWGGCCFGYPVGFNSPKRCRKKFCKGKKPKSCKVPKSCDIKTGECTKQIGILGKGLGKWAQGLLPKSLVNLVKRIGKAIASFAKAVWDTVIKIYNFIKMLLKWLKYIILLFKVKKKAVPCASKSGLNPNTFRPLLEKTYKQKAAGAKGTENPGAVKTSECMGKGANLMWQNLLQEEAVQLSEYLDSRRRLASWSKPALAISLGGDFSAVGKVGLGFDFAWELSNHGEAKPLITFSFCFGMKFDVSAGLGVGITIFNSIDSVPGVSMTFSVGGDIPKTEKGIDLRFVLAPDPTDFIGIGIDIGLLGVGIFPVDIEYQHCISIPLLKGGGMKASSYDELTAQCYQELDETVAYQYAEEIASSRRRRRRLGGSFNTEGQIDVAIDDITQKQQEGVETPTNESATDPVDISDPLAKEGSQARVNVGEEIVESDLTEKEIQGLQLSEEEGTQKPAAKGPNDASNPQEWEEKKWNKIEFEDMACQEIGKKIEESKQEILEALKYYECKDAKKELIECVEDDKVKFSQECALMIPLAAKCGLIRKVDLPMLWSLQKQCKFEILSFRIIQAVDRLERENNEEITVSEAQICECAKKTNPDEDCFRTFMKACDQKNYGFCESFKDTNPSKQEVHDEFKKLCSSSASPAKTHIVVGALSIGAISIFVGVFMIRRRKGEDYEYESLLENQI